MIAVKGKVMDAEMQHLQGVRVSEFNIANPLPLVATTDENGDFSLLVSSPEAILKFERAYYKPFFIPAKNFYSYVILDKAVIELHDDQTKKPKGLPGWAIALIAAGVVAAIGGVIYYNDPKTGKPQYAAVRNRKK